MREDVTVAQAGAEAVDELRDLFLALHRHHRSVVELPLVADDDAWRARRATSLVWFAEQRALLFVASAGETPVGYASSSGMRARTTRSRSRRATRRSPR